MLPTSVSSLAGSWIRERNYATICADPNDNDMTKLAIIGGTGLYDLPGLEDKTEREVETPFGRPSAALRLGRVGELELVFLPRHGLAHSLAPHEINYRANIYALKLLGVTHIVAVCAVGSLQENIKPGDFVAVDQFFDRTRKTREDSFFGEGLVAHIPFGDPVCPFLRKAVVRAARDANVRVHDGGTYVNVEGPAFSTRAESDFYRRQLGAAVIGMTNLTEAKLAREADMCYAILAQVTDYDCWHSHEEDVSASDILETLRRNTEKTKNTLQRLIAAFAPPDDCSCRHALASAFVTPWESAPAETMDRLRAIIAGYAPGGRME